MAATAPAFAHHARFLVGNTDRVTKFTVPSPFLIAVRYRHADHSREAYPTPVHFLDHLGEVLAREARAPVKVGVDIVQLDDLALANFCDLQLVAPRWAQGSPQNKISLPRDRWRAGDRPFSGLPEGLPQTTVKTGVGQVADVAVVSG
jgi:methionine synthase II (cobalamin-independent)